MRRFRAPNWRFWRSWSIRTRIILIAALPVLYLLISVIWYADYAARQQTERELRERAQSLTTALSDSLSFNLQNNNLSALKATITDVMLSDKNIVRIEVFDKQHKEIASRERSPYEDKNQREFEQAIKQGLVWLDLQPGNLNGKMAKQYAVLGYVKVTMTTSQILAKQRNRFELEMTLALLAAGFSLGLAWYLSFGLSDPLTAIIRSVTALRDGKLQERVRLDSGGEIGELQESINSMAHSLEEARQDLEERIAERTHALTASRNQVLQENAEKRRLIKKMHHIVEAERSSIAIEIHDELNAALIAIRLDAQRIQQLIQQAEPEREKISKIAHAIQQQSLALYSNGRNLVRRLRPEVLEMLGLAGALEDMLRQFQDKYPALQMEFVSVGDFAHLPHDLSMSLYRIAQEALSNVFKYAEAQHVMIKLVASQNGEYPCYELLIRDDGIGFDTDLPQDGVGLSGIRERVAAYDGELEIQSAAGQGTQIRARIMLLPGQQDHVMTPLSASNLS